MKLIITDYNIDDDTFKTLVVCVSFSLRGKYLDQNVSDKQQSNAICAKFCIIIPLVQEPYLCGVACVAVIRQNCGGIALNKFSSQLGTPSSSSSKYIKIHQFIKNCPNLYKFSSQCQLGTQSSSSSLC